MATPVLRFRRRRYAWRRLLARVRNRIGEGKSMTRDRLKNHGFAASAVIVVHLALAMAVSSQAAEFTAPVSYSAGSQPYSVTAGDFSRPHLSL